MIKVLIADDEPNILMLTALLFKEQGMTVISATNGEEAIEKAIQEKPDLIITDVVMPAKDGFEVCRTIRHTPEIASTPIIILSALGDEYNKITGFEDGADDYITKPFNVEELKARAKSLLIRAKSRKVTKPAALNPTPVSSEEDIIILTPCGTPSMDQQLFGGLPVGANILVMGETGAGKSSFVRRFIAHGLERGDRALYVALDDVQRQIRKGLTELLSKPIEQFEETDLLRFVDAYSLSSVELNQLSGLIQDAGVEIGQTVQRKAGGRRVIDSISSLLVNFELPKAQQFINQVSRTALAFGGVTTLFVLETGTVSEQVVNNIKYVMDGILEFRHIDGKYQARVASMKWAKYTEAWVDL